MNNKTWLAFVAVSGISASAFAAPQAGAHPATQSDTSIAARQAPIPYSKVDTLLGADIAGANGEKVADVDDFLFDADNGSLERVVVSCGGVLGVGAEKHVVPIEKIRWNSIQKDGEHVVTASTDMSQERLEAAPDYEAERYLGKTSDSESDSGDARGAHAAAETFYVCAEELDGLRVNGVDGKPLGEIETIAFDREHGRISYVVITEGGSLGLGESYYALPWSTLDLSRDDEGALKASTSIAMERVKEAPKYDVEDWKRMSSPEWARELYAYYSIDPRGSKESGKSSPTR